VKLSASGIGVIVIAVGALAAYQWYKKNRDALLPQSAAEKQVNVLYGPSQGWKATPVYNTPGLPGYIPTLPASYAPGTAPVDLTKITGTIGPAPYDNPMPEPSPGDTALTTVQPYLFGLGEVGAARVRNFRPARRIR
jgi:hypothetical protein